MKPKPLGMQDGPVSANCLLCRYVLCNFVWAFALFIFIPFGHCSGERKFYVTDTGTVIQVATNGELVIDPEAIELARHAQESKPASDDPLGNWGIPLNGLQTSIRFKTQEAGNDGPILATVILRNVGDVWRVFYAPLGLQATVIVINPDGQQLERIDLAPANTLIGKEQRIAQRVGAIPVFPGTQKLQEIDLRKYFDFSIPGKYVVYAKLKGGWSDTNASDEVQTGNAIIRLLQPPGPTPVTNNDPISTNRIPLSFRDGMRSMDTDQNSGSASSKTLSVGESKVSGGIQTTFASGMGPLGQQTSSGQSVNWVKFALIALPVLVLAAYLAFRKAAGT